MPTVTKRGENWRAQVRLAGYRPQFRTFPTRAAAKRWAAVTEGELLAGRRGEIIPRSVRAALQRYAAEVSPTHRGARWERVRLTKLERELGFADRQLAAVRAADIATWRDRALGSTKANGKPIAPASVRREMVLLRSVFERCRKEWGWLASNPMDGVAWAPKGAPRARRVAQAELAALAAAAGLQSRAQAANATQRAVLAFAFALETGMRAGEICALEAADVNTAEAWAILRHTKNGDARTVPLSKAAIAIVRRLPNGRLFDLAPASLDALFRALRQRAGIEGLHFHDSRHEAITRLARKLDVLDLARMVGTRDLKTLMVYYNPTPTEIAKRLG